MSFVVSFLVKLLPIENCIDRHLNSKANNKEDIKELNEYNEKNAEKIKIKEFKTKKKNNDEFTPKDDKDIIEINIMHDNELNCELNSGSNINKETTKNKAKYKKTKKQAIIVE